jgi:hypothetical protein
MLKNQRMNFRFGLLVEQYLVARCALEAGKSGFSGQKGVNGTVSVSEMLDIPAAVITLAKFFKF